MRHLLLLAVSLVAICAPAYGLKNITIGIVTSENTANPTSYRHWRYGLEYAIQGLNSVGPFVLSDGESYQYAMKRYEDSGNSTLQKQYYDALAADPEVDFMFASVGIPPSLVAKASALAAGRLIMGTTVGDLDWPNGVAGQAFTPALTAYRLAYSAFPLFRLNDLKTVSMVRSPDAYHNQVCGGAADAAKYNGFTVIQDYLIPDHRNGVTDTSALDTAFAGINEAKPDVVFICTFIWNQEYIVSLMRNHSLSPKALFTSSLYQPYKDPTLMSFISTFGTYNDRALYPEDIRYGPYFSSIKSYDSHYRQMFNVAPNDFSVLNALALLHLHQGILKANSSADAAVRNALFTSKFDTFMGTFSYDGSGLQQKDSLFFQVQGNVTRVVGPLVAQEAKWEFPFPTWEERVYSVVWGSAEEIIFLILMIIFSCSTIFFMIWVWVNWEAKVVRASSPSFIMLFLVGSLFLYASIIPFMSSLTNTAACVLRVFLLPCGFVLLFGAQIAKTWRVDRLYSQESMRVIRISDWRVAQIVGVLVLIQLLISVLGSTVTELRGDVVIIDAYRLSKNYPACFSTEAASTTLLIIEGVFVLFLLVVGGVLAFRVRRIPYDMYDESKVIFFTIYNVAFFAIVAIVLEFAIGSINDSNVRNIVFIIRSACTLLGTGISVLTFMISKMTMLKSTEKDSSNVTTALTRTTNNKSGGYASSVLKSTHSSSIGSADLTKVKYDAQRAKYKAKIELLHALLKEHNIAVPGEESSTSSSSDDDGTSTSSTDTSSTKKKKKDKKSDDVKIAVEADGANEVAEEDGDEEAEEADEEESSN